MGFSQSELKLMVQYFGIPLQLIKDLTHQDVGIKDPTSPPNKDLLKKLFELPHESGSGNGRLYLENNGINISNRRIVGNKDIQEIIKLPQGTFRKVTDGRGHLLRLENLTAKKNPFK